jgi:hypothetical protein
MLTDETIIEAKKEALVAQRHGLLYSPEEAWAVAGRRFETLWSIASRVALSMGADPEELCAYLEKAFPNCTLSKSHLDVHSIWDRDEGYL